MTEREIAFYSCSDDCESLTDTDPDDAIESHLDALWPMPAPALGAPSAEALLALLPKEITLYGWARAPLSHPLDAEDVVEFVLERWDEEHGDPDAATKPTQAMLDVARALLAVMRAEYTVWHCEIVSRETINVEAWVREHRADWLEVKA